MHDQAKRGDCWEFTAQSRLNMLRAINAVEFERCYPASFMTLTWRDNWPLWKWGFKQARDKMHQAMESNAGRKLSAFWRVEWEVRKSGQNEGAFWPHLHVLMFNAPIFNCRWIERKWMQVAHGLGQADVELKRAKYLKRMLIYIAKYIGKPIAPISSELVFAAYRARFSGRSWGTKRPDLIPFAKRTNYEIEHGELWEFLREQAREEWKGVPNDGETGFTLFGNAALKVKKILEKENLPGWRQVIA